MFTFTFMFALIQHLTSVSDIRSQFTAHSPSRHFQFTPWMDWHGDQRVKEEKKKQNGLAWPGLHVKFNASLSVSNVESIKYLSSNNNNDVLIVEHNHLTRSRSSRWMLVALSIHHRRFMESINAGASCVGSERKVSKSQQWNPTRKLLRILSVASWRLGKNKK